MTNRDKELEELCAFLNEILQKKNQAYGDSTRTSSEILRYLWPNGIPTERYYDARIVISILDKLARIATDRDAFGESPWLDVAGYAVLGLREAGRKSSVIPTKSSSPELDHS